MNWKERLNNLGNNIPNTIFKEIETFIINSHLTIEEKDKLIDLLEKLI